MAPKAKVKPNKPAGTRLALMDNLKKVGATLNRRPTPIGYISTGSNYLDSVMGGGFPRGRVTEVWGFPGSGKTTILKIAARTAMLGGNKVAWGDTEGTFNEAWAWKLGVPIDMQGDDGEYLLDFPYPADPETATMETWCAIILELVKANQHDEIIIDTWAHMSPRGEQETPFDKSAQMGLFAKNTTRLYRMLSPWLPVSKTAIVIVNQVRNQFGDEWNPFTSPGGWAMHHEASLRIQMFYPQTAYWDADKDEPQQHTFRFYKMKTKVGDSSKKLHSIMLVNDESREFWEYDQLAAIWDSLKTMNIFQNAKGEAWKPGSGCFFDVAGWEYPVEFRSTDKKDLNPNGWMKIGNSEDEIKKRIGDDPALLACVMKAISESVSEESGNEENKPGSSAADYSQSSSSIDNA